MRERAEMKTPKKLKAAVNNYKDGNKESFEELYGIVNGNKIKETRYDGDNNMRFSNQFEYDADNNLVKEINLYPDESENTIREYKYDSNGNLIEEVSYTEGDSHKTTTEYEYMAVEIVRE